MKKGKYIAFVEWYWRKESAKDNAIFRTYGSAETKIRVVTDENHPSFLKYVMRDCVINHSNEQWYEPWLGQVGYKSMSNSDCSDGDMMVVVIENNDQNYYVTVSHTT